MSTFSVQREPATSLLDQNADRAYTPHYLQMHAHEIELVRQIEEEPWSDDDFYVVKVPIYVQ